MFLICGEVLFDIFVDKQREDGLTLDARPGGSPYNVAMGLARLEHHAELFTGLSQDVLGRRLTDFIEQQGVHMRHCVRSTRPTAMSIVDVDQHGSPIYDFYGEKPAYCAITEADLPRLDESVHAIHIGSIATVLEPVASTLVQLAKREHQLRLISYDPNVRPSIEPDLQVWRDRVEQLSHYVHVLKISEEDLGLLYPNREMQQSVDEWLANGVHLVVITRGAEGALGWSQNCAIKVPGKSINLVDTVGAGDSFQAALLAGLAQSDLLSTESLQSIDEERLRWLLNFATQAAAITCSRRGADLPYHKDFTAP